MFAEQGKRPGGRVELLTHQDRTSPEFKPVNVLLCGRRGKGKTMTECAIAKRHKRLFVRLGLPWRVVSNHWLAFADLNDPYLLDHAWKENPFIVRKAEVCIDEITSAARSRRPTSRENVHAGVWVEQIRKLPAEVISTTQFPTEVDRYFTQQTDIFILCEARIYTMARAGYTQAIRDYWGERSYIDLYVFDLWGQWTGHYDIPKLGWPPPIWRADTRMRVWGLPAIWNEYRSQEVIPMMWGDQGNRAGIIGQQYDLESDEKTPDGEYFASVESDLAQGAREGTLPPVTEVAHMAPRSIHDLIADETVGGSFVVTSFLMTRARALEPLVKDMEGFKLVLHGMGYEVEKRDGGRVIATRRPA